MTFIRTTAIAWLTVRDAVRSRLMVSLAAILLVGLIGLPLLITGDNTLSGQLQVILNYTLTFALGMLSSVTLWAACGGVSSEIQDRRLYLVITKPVHRYELWIGKWLGIVALNATLLLLTGLVVGIMIVQTFKGTAESKAVQRQVQEQFLVAHQSVAPVCPDWAARVQAEANRLMQSGRAPAGMSAAMVQAELSKELKAARFIVPPGGAIAFDYRIPPRPAQGHDVILKYKIQSSRPEKLPIPAEWTIGGMKLDVTNYPGSPNTLVIPAAEASGIDVLKLNYLRLDKDNPATLMMADQGLEPELLMPSGNWMVNLSKGLLVMLCRLAFLAALGLTAGCLLSMPVAVFVAFFIMILLALSGYVEGVATSGVFYVPHEGTVAEQTLLDVAILHLFRVFNGITLPLSKLDPIPLLTGGRIVGWPLLAKALGLLVGLYTTLTAIVGISLFNRRELG